ncbi:MAG: tRNA (guanosine(46)-N7)-methyltransferase TrmB [Thermogutta sp.]
MGRRALRKIDPNLDLSFYYRDLAVIPKPWQSEPVFGRSAPLEVEVGSGKGLFLSRAAAGTPGVDFVGLEIAQKYARFSAARLAKLGVRNAVIIHGDAQRFFAEWLSPESVAAVHVYFPDPWWKKRHKKRRVINETFVRNVERVLQPQGRFHFWTDVAEYFETAIDLIKRSTNLKGPFPVPERPAENDMDFRTHFERRVRLQGGIIYRAEFAKLIPTGGD